ncbi:MAG: C39 family peptidase [Candidatus Zixiibacteriota bacterium]|nr:MAG: C39 family peptidase [candidate division Zixibacteria bacterium]
MKAMKAAVLVAVCLCSTLTWGQQSTSGPHRPLDADLGLRPESPAQVIIKDVPAYLWRHGCGPTAAGMVIGYWDSNGYPDLVPGDAITQTAAVDAVIADDGGVEDCDNEVLNHYTDYACPIERSILLEDKSELGGEVHQDNCLADFMLTSRSSEGNKYGWSWFIHVAPALTGYVKMVYPGADVKSENIRWADFSWERFKEEIDNNRPMVLLVDSWAHYNTDHFVTAIGYNDETMEYAIYDEWDTDIHWYRWHENAPGEDYGVYGITTFSLPRRGGHSKRGDVDGNGRVDIDDVEFLISYLNRNGPAPGVFEAADVNGDGALNIGDIDYLIGYLFRSGPAPVEI